MKCVCTKENLSRGLLAVSHLPQKNTTLPILSHVLLRADQSSLRLISTNLEVGITCSVRGKIEREGECAVPAKLFSDYVQLLPNDPIELEMEGQDLLIRCGSHETRMKGLPVGDFPLVPPVTVKTQSVLPVEGFRQALQRTLFSVAHNEARPELSGVCLFFPEGGKEAVFASTDSYRLSEMRLLLEGAESAVSSVKAILPARTLSEVYRIVGVFKDDTEAPEMVSLGLSDNQMVVTYANVEIVSRSIEGNYPDYTQIIPQTFRTEVTLDREDFLRAIKTASLFSKSSLNDLVCEISSETQTLRLNAEDAGRGKSVAPCEAQVTGEDNRVTLNYRYLLDGLNALSTDQIVFSLIDSSSPCVLTPKGASGYLYVLMPIRT